MYNGQLKPYFPLKKKLKKIKKNKNKNKLDYVTICKSGMSDQLL
jgi:hypothetical protein